MRSTADNDIDEILTFSTQKQPLSKKTAVLSHVLPPSPGGQCVALSHILESVDPQDYVLITHERQNPAPEDAISRPLPARQYAVCRSIRLDGGWRRVLGPLASAFSLVINVVYRTVQVTRVLRRERCTAMVACSGDPYNLAAAYLATRILGVSLHPYLFDDPVYQWPDGRYRRFAQLMSPRMMQGARSIIVPNEFLRDELHQRYGVDSVIVRNPVVTAAVRVRERSEAPPVYRTAAAEAGSGGIVYTGAISYAHYDAFRNLIAGLHLLRDGDGGSDPRLTLHVYTITDQDLLSSEGIEGPVSVHRNRAHERIRAVQAAADILFLPLGFETPIPELIRTSAPGKMGEYLASGRPILVHAPADCFISWYFRTHRCGFVVDEPSPQHLVTGVRRLLNDMSLRSELVSNAVARAHDSFDVRVSRDVFRRALENVY